jgi:hypothetical protein
MYVDNTMYKTEKEHTRRFKFGKRRIRNRTEVSPTVGICPRSRENAGPVDLPVSDAIWDAFTPFQRFLWYADEMEHRWYSLQNMFNNDSNSDHVIVGLRGVPSFYEATWNDADELKKSVSDIRNKLSCTTEMELKNKHPHVEHRDRALNCSDQILQESTGSLWAIQRSRWTYCFLVICRNTWIARSALRDETSLSKTFASTQQCMG